MFSFKKRLQRTVYILRKSLKSFLFTFIAFTPLFALPSYAEPIEKIAKKFNLYGGEKATVQWKRVFSSKRHLQRYQLDELDQTTREKLEKYLIEHAADSEQPIVPGVL